MGNPLLARWLAVQPQAAFSPWVTPQAGAGRTALFTPINQHEWALRTQRTKGDREGVCYEGLGLTFFRQLGC